MRKILEQVKGKDFETARLILLAKNFVFNQEIKFILTEKNEEIRQKKFDELSKRLKLPKDFAHTYAIYKKPLLKDIEARQSIYYVHELEGKPKKVIDEDGIYIKFDPQKTDNYYKRLIKQLRALFAFLDASEQEKELYFKQGGHSTFHFLDHKKAMTPRHQQGSNLEQDIKIYLVCESTIKTMFSVSIDEVPLIEEDNQVLRLYHALEEAAFKLKLEPTRVKSIYYEVCRRYKLPTLTKDPIFS